MINEIKRLDAYKIVDKLMIDCVQAAQIKTRSVLLRCQTQLTHK